MEERGRNSIATFFFFIHIKIEYKAAKVLILTIDISALLIFPLWKMKWLLLCVEQFGAVCYNTYCCCCCYCCHWCHCCFSAIAAIYFGLYVLHVRPIHKLYWGLFIRVNQVCVCQSMCVCVCIYIWSAERSRGVFRSALLAFHFIFHLVQITMCF